MMIHFLPNSGKIYRKFSQLLALIGLFLMFTQAVAQTPEAEKNFQVCKACHNIDGPKLIGPSLAGVTQRHNEAWLFKFIRNSQLMIQAGDPAAVKLFEENNRIPMPPNDLTDAQIKDILLYIENGGKVAAQYAVAEPTNDEKAAKEALLLQIEAEQEARLQKLADIDRDANRNFGTTFWISIIILLLVVFDLFISKVIKAKFVHAVLILVSVFVIGEIVYKEATALGRQQYYQPEQPIWFSHKVHAEQNKIDCQYCHSTVEHSKNAGIPSVNVCMNCHHQVRKGKITGTEQIDKIHKAWDSGQPIQWIKVHNLPDHVFFSHAQHVKSGKISCNDCHGPIETMHEVMQVNDLSMGWCLDCHRKTEVQFAGNNFYKTYEKLHAQMKNGQIKKVTADMVGGADCMKCHY